MGSLRGGTRADVLSWGVASAQLPGEPCSGDLHLVKTYPGGALVAVVDGLGHGVEAAEVARKAVESIEEHPGEPLVSLLKRCDEALHGTRGAVLSLASFDSHRHEMSWLGLGNVEGFLIGAPGNGAVERQALVSRGGVVGSRLGSARATTLSVQAGDLLIFATDGIRADFTADIRFGQEPQQMADLILARCTKGTDDALVLVARYLGGRA
jgi:hypothetical protein